MYYPSAVECANRPQAYMHIQGVCMCVKCGDMFVRTFVCQRATLIWPACTATSSVIGSSFCSFRAGRLSCLGSSVVEMVGGGLGRQGFCWPTRMFDCVLPRGKRQLQHTYEIYGSSGEFPYPRSPLLRNWMVRKPPPPNLCVGLY